MYPDPPHPLYLDFLQGRHVKTGQLAAIKVMDVTEVGDGVGKGRAGLTSKGGCRLRPYLPPYV